MGRASIVYPGSSKSAKLHFRGKFLPVHPLNEPETRDWPLDRLEGESSLGKGQANEVQEVSKPASFDDIYDLWFDEVSKWIRAMGAPEAERDDLTQEVFIVVHRRLKDFNGENLAGWIYQISRHKVRDFRRRQWVRKLVFMERGPDVEAETAESSPLMSLETREKRGLLMKLLGDLNENERVAVVLFEVEGYSGQQIAEIQSAPLNTVWTRIHKAREKLKMGLLASEGKGGKRVRS